MSLSNVKPYFSDRLQGLGYSEWPDGFAVDNIPETVLDRSFHILIESVDGGAINHTHQDTTTNVVIRLFFKGFRLPSEAIDTSVASIEEIIRDVCKVANRTATLFNVVFESADINPLNAQNDNGVFVEMRFSARVIIGVEE